MIGSEKIMPYILVRHKVQDYKRWRAVFDLSQPLREKGGEISAQVFFLSGTPKDLMILFEWDNMDNARKYMLSTDLRRMMVESGVDETPNVYILENAP